MFNFWGAFLYVLSLDEQTITYDIIGNSLTYRDGMSFGWSAGRKLTSFTLNNGASYVNGEYVYDDNGIRVYKNINGNETKYYLNGSAIQTEITNYGGITRRVDYIYDEAGSIYGFSVDGVDYYYIRNWQGDIIGILDKTGNLLVEYVYDAYGVPTVSFPGIVDGMTDAEKNAIYLLGNNNPFRYRGYYFDVESGLYYLNSRYYDPVTGRFVNSDGQLNVDILGNNLFAYCSNNPIIRVDVTGMTWKNLFEIVDNFCKIINGPVSASEGFSFITNLSELSVDCSLRAYEYCVKTGARPKNIGKGVFAKQTATELSRIAKVSENVSTAFLWLEAVEVGIEVNEAIQENVNNNASPKKIITDAAVDITFSFARMWAAMAYGAYVGNVAGSVFPGYGNVIGTVAGAVVGAGLYALTDGIRIKGKTISGWVKEGLNSLW